MKYTFAVIAAALSAMLSPTVLSAQFSDVTDIDDLVLIYVGNRDRTEWTADKLKPYVVHTYEDGSRSWMFDGFLMIDFLTYNKAGTRVSLGEYNGPGADRQDWLNYLDAQLGTSDNRSCRALDGLIGSYIPELGRPSHRHKVVFSLPIPVSSFTEWGELDGRKLDFNNIDDKLAAMSWYVDVLLEKWKEAGFKNLDLDGIYWVKESFDQPTVDLARGLNGHIRSLGLKVYWVPYSQGKARADWRKNGIDVAYMQPNYSVWPHATIDQLDSVIEFAKSHGMGLEVEFDGYSFYRDMKGDSLVRTLPRDCCLYDVSPEFHQRFKDYVDRYEREKVFDTLPMAYYTGYQAVYDFENSPCERDRRLLDRLAAIINRRHIKSGWIKE